MMEDLRWWSLYFMYITFPYFVLGLNTRFGFGVVSFKSLVGEHFKSRSERRLSS
jgi:hypothetical protein